MVDTSQIASEALGLYENADNSSRNGLRKLARKILNDTDVVAVAAKSRFVSDYSVPINKAVDMVHRHVLLDIISSGLDEYVHKTTALTGECFKRIGEALLADGACKIVNGSASKGYNVFTPSEELMESIVTSHVKNVNKLFSPDNLARQAIIAGGIIMETVPPIIEGQSDAATRMGVTKAMVERMGLDTAEREAVMNAVLSKDFDALIEDNPYDTLTQEYAARVDDLCAKHVGQHTSTTTPPNQKEEPVQEATHKEDPITVDPDFRSSVDLILNKATGGRVTNIDVLIKAQSRVGQMMEEIEELKTKAADAASSFAKSGKDEVDGETLTYEVVMRDASEIFKDAHGKQSQKLKFEVPTLVWRDALGQEVRHPDCPDIDPTYQFRMYMLIKFLSAIKFGHNSWLHGHTGTGKTTFIEQVAAYCGFPVERLNLDSNLERSDVVGGQEITVEDGAPKTVYREGILPRAMQKPCWFICDEIDAGRADMLFVLQRALEGKGITITEDGGRVVAPHDLFRFVATANSRGQGDEFGFYAGVRPLNIAMLDRFTMFIEVPYLDKDDEMRLLKTAYPTLNDNERNEFCEFSQKVRGAFINGEISKTLSPRGLHSMATYYLHFKTVMTPTEARLEAAKVAVIDAAPSDNRHTIEQMFNTLVG